MKPVEHCENCGRAIGRLEQQCAWRKHVVCAECHARLSAPAAAAQVAPRPAQAAPRPAQAAPRPAQAAPMLLCAACGRAHAFGDVVSDNGKVTCRACALAAAARKAAAAARDKRASVLKKLSVASVALLALGGGTAGTLYVAKARPDRKVAAITGAPRPTAGAAAEQIMTPGRASDAAVSRPAAPPAAATEPVAPVSLFAPPDAIPQSRREPVAPGPRQNHAPPSAASLAPAVPPPTVAPPGSTGSASSDATTAGEPAPGVRTGRTARAGANAAPVARSEPEAPVRARAALPPEGTADRHVYDGRQLLALGKYPLALEPFNAAMKKDRNHPDAWHGTALCHQGMGDRNAALERLEKAVTLYAPPSRAAVFNCAAANLRENPTRAAKMIRDYLDRPDADPDAPDEPMHALMGKALFSVNRQGRQNKVWVEAQEFYFAYNQRLESARRDGRGRWGGEWVPARDAAEKWDRYRSRQQNVESLRTSVDRATKAKKDAWDKLRDQQAGMRLISDREQREGRQRYEQAAKQEITLRNQLRTAEVEFNSAEKPPFPQVIKMVPMDEPYRSPGHAAR